MKDHGVVLRTYDVGKLNGEPSWDTKPLATGEPSWAPQAEPPHPLGTRVQAVFASVPVPDDERVEELYLVVWHWCVSEDPKDPLGSVIERTEDGAPVAAATYSLDCPGRPDAACVYRPKN